MSTAPVVEIHDLTISYHKKPVLWDVDLRLPAGKLMGIIGPNGAGKSTLLKAIMGLIPLDSGYVQLFGEALSKVRKQVSYIPQRESVDWNFPASVHDVVLMGRYGELGLFRRPSQTDKAFAMECLAQVGMEALADRQIGQLSGGQQQRVFLARALAQRATLYLMDEPFAGIDAATEKIIIQLLKTMAQQGKSVIVVHHDLQTARDYFEWVILLNMRLIGAGPAQDMLTTTLLQETYGSQLTLLSHVSELLHTEQRYARESHT
ncbi:MAG: metal ABC transporter ATP-binding protein [Bacteroidota bacterium]